MENVTTFKKYNSVHFSLSKAIIPLKGEVMQGNRLTFFIMNVKTTER